MGLYVPSECHQDWKTKFQCVMSGRFLKARFKCPLAHFEHNMRAACFDMMNKISLLTMCWRGTNRSRYASNVHLVLSFHLHVCLLVQPNYANKGEEDSLLQIMTLKGVYCSRKTVLVQRRQGWPPTLIVDWVYERSIALVHIDNMERYGYDVDVDVVRQSLQEFLQLCSRDLREGVKKTGFIWDFVPNYG